MGSICRIPGMSSRCIIWFYMLRGKCLGADGMGGGRGKRKNEGNLVDENKGWDRLLLDQSNIFTMIFKIGPG